MTPDQSACFAKVLHTRMRDGYPSSRQYRVDELVPKATRLRSENCRLHSLTSPARTFGFLESEMDGSIHTCHYPTSAERKT